MRRTANIFERGARSGSQAQSCGEADRIANDVIQPQIASLQSGTLPIERRGGGRGNLGVCIEAPFGSDGKIEPEIDQVGLKGPIERGLSSLDRIKTAIGIGTEKMKLKEVSKPGLDL